MENDEINILSIQEITNKFLANKKILYRYCLRNLTKNIEDTEDLLSEVYEKILKYRESFNGDTNFGAWCFTIAKRTYIDKYRKSEFKHNHVECDIESGYIGSGDISYLSDISLQLINNGDSSFIQEDVRCAISSIKQERDRTIIFMLMNGYRYHEIAEYFAIPIGTVKNRIHTIKEFLAEKLKDYKI